MRNIILFLLIIYESRAQLYFPDDNINVYNRDKQGPARYPVTAPTRNAAQDDYIEGIVARGISNLGLSVNSFNLDQSTNRNIVLSPLSIACALALILLGSNGRTFDEIANVMGVAAGININSRSQDVHEHLGKLLKKLEDTTDIEEQVKVAAGVFVQNSFPIRSLYKQVSEDIYRNEILNLDFVGNPSYAQNVINAWVSDRTAGKIKDIIPEPPPSSTKVIIVSALYYNGPWENPFYDGMTRRRAFYPNGRNSRTDIEVDMMANGGAFAYYKDPNLNCELLGMPYKGNHTTMYVVKPIGSNTQILKNLEKRITVDDLERMIASTRLVQTIVLFPRMKLESTMNLRKTLQHLGVNALFNPSQANLAVLSPGPNGLPPASSSNSNANQLYESLYNPISPNSNQKDDSLLIFSRSGFPINCTEIFYHNSNITKCEDIDKNTNKPITYKKFGDKIGRRATRQTGANSLDKLRNVLNSNPNNRNAENPGLYADQVLHKVYIDVTEKGTEAAAATSASISRGGDIVNFVVDTPFLFFIRSEETKLILFWGTVYLPTPSYKTYK